MNQHHNKRRLRAHLVFIYGLMALAVISIVAILIFVILGYRYNSYDGKLEQGGLVQFDSRPSGATVTADGINLSNRTASKITLTSGDHTIMMAHDGYGSWTKNITVKAGGVLWLNYALLFPNNPTLSTIHTTTAATTSALASPDNKKLATVSSDTGAIELTSLDTDSPETTKVTIPASNYTAATDGESKSFSLVQWDKDSHLLLVRYTHGTSDEYLSVNVQDAAATKNLTTGLGVAISSVAYSRSDSNTLYLLTSAHELRRVSLGDMTMTGPLVSNVSSFQATEKNFIVYTTLPDATMARAVGYISSNASKSRVVRTYPALSADTSLMAISGSYYGDHYIVIAHGETVDILEGDLPSSAGNSTLSLTSVGAFSTPGGASYLGFSSESNRIIYAQSGSTVTTYDLELASTARTTLQGTPTRQVDWIDGYHMASAADRNGVYSDYDGTNGVTFATNISDLPVTLASGSKYLYYFVPSDAGTKLIRATMTTN